MTRRSAAPIAVAVLALFGATMLLPHASAWALFGACFNVVEPTADTVCDQETELLDLRCIDMEVVTPVGTVQHHANTLGCGMKYNWSFVVDDEKVSGRVHSSDIADSSPTPDSSWGVSPRSSQAPPDIPRGPSGGFDVSFELRYHVCSEPAFLVEGD